MPRQQKHVAEIRPAMAEGQKAEVTGMLAFLSDFPRLDSNVKATKKISVAVPYANFKARIDKIKGDCWENFNLTRNT